MLAAVVIEKEDKRTDRHMVEDLPQKKKKTKTAVVTLTLRRAKARQVIYSIYYSTSHVTPVKRIE